MKDFLQETKLLNYSHKNIQGLIKERNWSNLDDFCKIKETYNFVRDEIYFGYNTDDNITASKVLADGFGQCNTKATLFMALLRAVGIPCRIHGFTIDKKLQKGAMTGFVYKNAPRQILHTWVEVYFDGIWYELEGLILDTKYLTALQKKFSACQGEFCGYGVAVKNFKKTAVDWNRNNTYIQSNGIVQDFGVFISPDELFKEHSQQMTLLKRFAYRNIGRHLMNRNIHKIRDC